MGIANKSTLISTTSKKRGNIFVRLPHLRQFRSIPRGFLCAIYVVPNETRPVNPYRASIEISGQKIDVQLRRI